MMTAPDSMIAAAKKVAEFSRLPWPTVQRTYRALQSAEFLPVSRGRAIWYAHPNLVGALLIGLACPERTIGERVTLFQSSTPNGDGFEPLCFRNKLSRLLTEEGAASDLDHIVFEADSDRVVVVTKASDGSRSKVETHYLAAAVNVERTEVPLVQTRTVISGDLIRALQENVAWRPPSQPPYVDGEDELEAE